MFPPSEDMVMVESIRSKFDPLARLIRAHITLVLPFESELSAPALREHILSTSLGALPSPVMPKEILIKCSRSTPWAEVTRGVASAGPDEGKASLSRCAPRGLEILRGGHLPTWRGLECEAAVGTDVDHNGVPA